MDESSNWDDGPEGEISTDLDDSENESMMTGGGDRLCRILDAINDSDSSSSSSDSSSDSSSSSSDSDSDSEDVKKNKQ